MRTSRGGAAEVVARAPLTKMTSTDEFSAATSHAFSESSSGVNQFAGQSTVVGSKTYIPAFAWNPDVFGYFDTALWMNKIQLGRMLSGTLLKQYYWKVAMETSNPTGASEAAKMTSFGIPYFDRRMDTILSPDKALFMFSGNSVAMATKARHAAYGPEGRMVDIDGGGRQRWYTIKSNSLPGVVYDIAYQEICVGGDIKHMWKIKTRGGSFLNPLDCDNDQTGMLKEVAGGAQKGETCS